MPGQNGTGCLSSSSEGLCYLPVFNSVDFLLNICLRTNSAGQQRNKTPTDFKRGLAQCLNATFGHRSCRKSVFLIPSAGDPTLIPPGNKTTRRSESP